MGYRHRNSIDFVYYEVNEMEKMEHNGNVSTKPGQSATRCMIHATVNL